MESTPGLWSQSPFFCLKTELSPATLFHSASNYFGCFSGLAEDGLGGPAFAAYASKTGIKIAKAGEAMDAPMLDECWILVWFAGAKGWTNWDSPWAVFLQHKPRRMKLNEGGLQLEFPGAAGDIVLLPLYGYFKPPAEKGDFLVAHGLPGKKIKTWEWSEALPKGPLMRVRYWASALREFPVYCEDSFSVDRAHDSVTIRQAFRWRSIEDEWNTKHLKLAPLSPPLALATQDKSFPATVSKSVLDHDLFTPYGPYMGVEGADTYDVTLRVLRYVNETEFTDPPPTNAHPSVSAAIEKLRATSRATFGSPGRHEVDAEGGEKLDGATAGDQWYAKCLPYMDEPTRALALASLRKHFREEVLVTNRFGGREDPNASGRTRQRPEGSGADSQGDRAAAERSRTHLLESLWAYAHFSGDWDLIKERWPLVKEFFTPQAGARWVTFGNEAEAGLGEGASPCLAMARMAFKVGDMDSYNYACYRFAQELVHHQIRQTSVEYFRRHQPWHSMEAMEGEVYLTRASGDLGGWRIDGPNYPRETGERQFIDRWVGFNDPDVGRFYSDYLRTEVRTELDLWQRRRESPRRVQNAPMSAPSMVQLRSLLLNETPAELAATTTPDHLSGPPSRILARCLAVIRASHPKRYQRLIPEGPPSPFVAGGEREVPGPSRCLIPAVQFGSLGSQSESASNSWPQMTWPGWKTPIGSTWSFGRVTPARKGSPTKIETVPLNWNCEAASCSWR